MGEKVDVLLVDDKIENLISLEEVLSAPDLNFIRASSGEEALESSLSCRPALILLDVQMPGMNGFEVARLLRGTELTRNIPIIFVTATHREEKFAFEGFESGAVDYLFKPLNPVIVRSKVRVFVELHRKSIQLEKLVHDLSLLNHELEAFSYSVSHDLRAPVRAVTGFSQAALDALDQSEAAQARENIQRVVSAGETMNGLIDSLLDLAKVTRLEMKNSAVNLSQMVRRLGKELQDQDPGRKVELQILEDLVVQGDHRLLEAALRNLIGNAFKFTSKIDVARIEFGVNQSSEEKVFFIKDNGAGFDMAFADRLFSAFQRLHNSKEFEGTGVGLATVKRIIHRHNGRIWVQSKKNEGATFFFTVSN